MLLSLLMLGVDPSIVVNVNVGLLGFSGEGAWQFELNAGELHSLLERLLPERRPSCGPEATPMGVTYRLNYNVVLMQTGLPRLQRTLATAMRPTADHGVYDVEASAIEEHFDMLYASYFATPPLEQPAEPHVAEGAVAPAAYTILVVNPNKGDMAQLADIPPAFSYRYRYHGGAPSQMWLSARRYLVFDVSAGPCSLGMSHAAEGAVSAASLPQIHAALQGGAAGLAARKTDPAAASQHALYHTHFMAQLCAVLLSAVRHIIAADLHTCDLPDFDELVVPLLALRNHALHDPLQPGHAFSLDLPRLGAQLRKLLLPGQTLTLLPSTHELHTHPQISVAVTRAMQADSVHEPRGVAGRYVARARPYLDAEGLAHQLRLAVDWLALPLLGAAAASALHRPSSSVEAAVAAANRTATAPGGGSGGGERRRRVLPVYLLSLVGLHEEMLLQRDASSSSADLSQLSHAAADLVISLQTEQQSVATPYFDDDGAVRTSPRDATRHVLAGLAAAIGAIPPPYHAHLPGGGAAYDFAWATGHHPFGPFANSSALSQTIADAARRNAILSRLHQVHLTLRAAAAALEAAAMPYVHATDTDSPQHRQQLSRLRAAAVGGGAAHAAAVVAALGEDAGGELQRLLLLRLQRGALRLSSATVQHEVLRHFVELCGFDAPLADAAKQLQLQRWQPAHAQTSSLLARTSTFLDQLQTDLGRLQEELACCATAHAAPPSYHLRSALLLTLGAALVYGATVWLASPSRKKPGQRRQ